MNQSRFFGHGIENAWDVVKKDPWWVELFDLSGIEHQDLVTVHDGLQPVSRQ